jgi:hypothetical protein
MSDPDNPISIALRDMAEQAAPPRLQIDAAWRAGRRRRRAVVTTSVAGAVAAAAAAVLVPLALLGAPAHPAPRTLGPPAIVPRLTYAMTINGQSVSFPRNGTVPSYHVRRGEHLVMTVAVTVPRHLRITALWLGISTGTWGSEPDGRPIGGMHPILAHTCHPLSAGVHTFGLRWHIPEHPSGSSFFLVNGWTSSHPPAAVAAPIVELALN